MTARDVPIHATREAWLREAAAILNGDVFGPKGFGLNLDLVRVGCSWPAAGDPGRVVGQCFKRAASPLAVNEVFVSPLLSDPMRVLDVLVHELCHAYDDCESKHGGMFKRVSNAVGLEGPRKATHAGPELVTKLTAINEALGTYAHPGILLLPKEKKQKTYMLKCTCSGCEFTFRTTLSQIDSAVDGLYCPGCGGNGIVDVDLPEEPKDE